MTSSVGRRLAMGFGAQALGPVVTLGIQLLNVPLYLKFWGPNLYGEWLILSAVPAYLAMSDIGFGTVAGNEMMMLAASEDRAGAADVFRSCSAFVVAISFLLFAIAAAMILAFPVDHWLNLSLISGGAAKNILLLLCLDAVLCIQPSLLLNGFKAANRFALGMLVTNIMRAAEGGLALIILFAHARPVHVALMMVSVRIVGTLIMAFMVFQIAPWLKIGLRGISLQAVKRLAVPAFAFMTFPLANAISIQGMTVVVGIVAGPAAVALFSPMRTMTRGLLQVIETIKNSIWPELSYAIGSENWGLGRKIFRIAMQLSVYLSIFGSLGMILFGPWIFAKWTHGRVGFSMATFILLLLSMCLYSIWNTGSVVLTAANQHEKIALYFLLTSVASLALAAPLVHWLGLPGAPLAQVLAVDLLMIFPVVPASCTLLKESTWTFLRGIVDVRDMAQIPGRILKRKV